MPLTRAQLALGVAILGALACGREGAPVVGSPSPLRVRRVSTTVGHACAVFVDGSVRCWGDDVAGELGNGLTDEECTRTPFAPECSLRPNVVVGVENAVQVSVGGRRSCALLADATVVCWGADAGGAPVKTPKLVAGLPADIAEIYVGWATTCARTSSGDVWCWDFDLMGAPTPFGPPPPLDEPRRIDGIDHAAQIAIGENHVCVRISDGHLRCWGFDHACELLVQPDAFPDGVARSPFEVPGITDAVEISAGSEGTVVLHADGTLTLSGCDPLPSAVLSSLHDTVHVSGGGSQVCTTDRSGLAHCYGNLFLGDGTHDGHFDRFVDVVGIDRVQQISTSGQGGCAVVGEGDVFCWGANDVGQVGDGTATDRAAPVAVSW